MAGVEDGLVVVLGALVEAVAAGFAVPHLRTSEEVDVEEINQVNSHHVAVWLKLDLLLLLS